MEEKNDIANELEVYQAIKPYIAHCLTMNHEINNPLAGIIGYSEFLLEESES
ncbi:MAG: histidine kinase dimerization/phospho-acceptor domain-containing protein, partial [Candidatus Zixiibacteriota bacterium]